MENSTGSLRPQYSGIKPFPRKWLVAIFLLGFLFRIGISLPHLAPLYGDQLYYDNTAWNIAQGHGFTAAIDEPRTPSITRTPGYPAVLAVIYRLMGHSVRAGLVLQAAIDSTTAVMVAMVGGEILSGACATLAGFLYALFPYAAILSATLSQDQLAALGVVGSLWLLLRALNDPLRWTGWLNVGLAVGVTAMVKPFLVLWYAVPLVMLVVRRMPWKAKLRAVAVSALAIALVITPWVVRNYVQFRAFPPLASGGPGAVMELVVIEMDFGESAYVSAIKNDWGKLAGSEDSYRSSVYVDGREMIDLQKKWEAEAMHKILRRWPEYLLVVAKHVPRLWLTMFSVNRSSKQVVAAFGLSVAVLVFGALGIYFSRHAWRELLPLYGTILAITTSYSFYVPEGRYTLPARACMMFFIAVAIREYWVRLLSRRRVHRLQVRAEP